MFKYSSKFTTIKNMNFTKYTGLGNDFVFLDGKTALSVTNPAALAREMCDRRFGIGADGLVLLLPSQKADVRMQIFNSDGSEAEMCGNASRCAALHVYRRKWINRKNIVLETLAGPIYTEILDEKLGIVCVDMGRPRLTRKEIPLSGAPDDSVQNITLSAAGQNWTGTAVSMGNPHFVIFVDDIFKIDLQTVGPQIETHPLFPRKTNVEFVQVLGKNAVRMRVWERGAGITQACGTGACATAVAGVLTGKTAEEITVVLDGGNLEIAWPQRNNVLMTGHAQAVFEGDFYYDPTK